MASENISIIAVGIDNWGKYTYPLIKSWAKWAKRDSELLIVDNKSDPPYPMDLIYCEFGDKVKGIRSDVVTWSYPEAINWGLYRAEGPWYMVLNNDVLFKGPIRAYPGLNPNFMYANQVLSWEYLGLKVPYPSGWHYFFHKTVLDKVGYWDSAFESSIADDLDYGWRCWKAGVPIVATDMPIEHLEQEHHPTRKPATSPNRQYFWEKHGFTGNYRGGR